MAINSQMNSDIGIHSGMRVPKSQFKGNEGNKDEFSKIFQSKTNESKPKVSKFETNDKKFDEVKPKDTEKFEVGSSRDKLTSKSEKMTDEKEVALEEDDISTEKAQEVVLEDFLALLNQPSNEEIQPVVIEAPEETQIQVSENASEKKEIFSILTNEEVLIAEGEKNSDEGITDNVASKESVFAEVLVSESNLKDTIKKALNMESKDISETHELKASDYDEKGDLKLYPVPENPKVFEMDQEQTETKNENKTVNEINASKILAAEEQVVKIVQEPKEKDVQSTFKFSETEEASEPITLGQSKETPTNGFQQMINRQPIGVFSQESSTVLPKNPIANQVFEMIKGPIHLSESGTMLKMKLQPEELGQVQLKLSLQKGMVLAEIKVENELVKAAMESNIEQLKQSLSNKGFQVSQVSVAVDLNNKDQAQSQFGHSNQGQNQRANKYFETNEEFSDESLFEALQLKDRGIGTSIDYSG